LAPISYGRYWSQLLYRYYRAPDHPAKLRLLRYLEHLSGDRRIVCPTRYGFSMALDKTDFVQRHILYDGEYEPEVTQVFREAFTPGDVFYDIGAHVGYYSCMALASGVKHVCSFEPDPLTNSVLRLNLELNQGLDRAEALQFAVGDEIASRTFYRAAALNTGMSGFTERQSVDSFSVDVRTLDSFVSQPGALAPTIMKIDVEGHEMAVLAGAATLFKTAPPHLIVFEGPPDLLAPGASYPHAPFLERYGYRVTHVPRNSGQTEEVENYAARRA
jgi:FkbM family methyltransferase